MLMLTFGANVKVALTVPVLLITAFFTDKTVRPFFNGPMSLSENQSWYPTKNNCSLKINHTLIKIWIRAAALSQLFSSFYTLGCQPLR
jgi:hypothetical protein